MSWLASLANWIALLATSGLVFVLHRRLRNLRGDLKAYRRAIGEMTVALSAADRALRGLVEDGQEIASVLAGSVADARLAVTAARAVAAAPAPVPAVVPPVARQPDPPPEPKPVKIWQQPLIRPQPLARPAAAKPVRAFWPTVSRNGMAAAVADHSPILARYREFA
jgi:hypothetical protein